MQCGIELLQEQPWEEAFPGGVGGTWVDCWVCVAGLSEPLPHYSLEYSVAKYHDPMLVTFGQVCYFRDSQLSNFLFL